jgi:hypothetical protein
MGCCPTHSTHNLQLSITLSSRFYIRLQLGINPEEALKKYETERIPRTSILQERAVAEGERAYKDDRAQQLAKAAKNWTPDEFDDWLYNRHYTH